MAGLAVAPAPNASASALAAVGLPPDATAAKIAAALPAEEADRQLLLDHALKVMLYQPASSGRGVARQTPLGMANAAAAAATGGEQVGGLQMPTTRQCRSHQEMFVCIRKTKPVKMQGCLQLLCSTLVAVTIYADADKGYCGPSHA